uniref:Retrotransposon gag domain-containing protein n=1 Tax=Brassica oleracea var. oleracea TaxID=109376 RepID=A0A0D2ZR16_BRAOL
MVKTWASSRLLPNGLSARFAVDRYTDLESENLTLRDKNQALNAASNKKRRFRTQVRPKPTLEIPNSRTGANLQNTAPGGDASTREKAKDAQTYDDEDSDSEPEPDKEASGGAARTEFPMIAHLHQMFSNRLDAMQSMVERLPEMPRKFSFPSIKAYEGTTDPDNHVSQYRQRMLAVALPKGSREATMCKSFGSTLTGPALQWYINLPSKSIASFAVLSDKFVEQFASRRDLEKTSDSLYEILQHRAEPLRGYIARLNQEKVAIPECSIPTAISAFKRGLLPDGDLYKELTKYQCKTMEDVLSRALAQVKWEEGVARRAKAQQKPDPKTIRPDQSAAKTRSQDDQTKIKPGECTRTGQSRRQKGWQCPRGQTSLTSPSQAGAGQCSEADGPADQVQKPEDCVALKIEVNELLRKGHLREFHPDKSKSHLSKETTGKPTEAAPVSPPRHDRVIHVILGGLEISGISHPAAKKSTWNAKHGLEAAKQKSLLLGTDEISFTAKEQEKVLTPHNDALFISLTVVNCLVRRILVDNGSSGNIIFQAA